MTKRLFMQDPYLGKCKAKVLSIDGNKVVLDQSVFFAFAGGQASDKGSIGGVNVVEAIDGEPITYVLEHAPSFSVGDEVDVVIDEEFRAIVRRLHSATHVACYYWEQKTGIKDFIGSNVDARKGRFDFEYKESVSAQLPELEKQCNEFISGNHEVLMTCDDSGKWTWKSEEVTCNCCGTHVRNTSEIGPIKLKRKNIGSGKERIEVMLA